ncbi:methyltransferase domain-containing protein [Nocardiopsis sp. EMB25]|uniref:methyltransferase domain-containing protein n=1 Tax=Nocardiopsis sp. EMB25 TaxID=2835867 RepID=UPI002285204E|nr:methyltransferase domain-containing protein [Nocardiopsis sp. EMB25]MCY9786703.1 methyltransferase domain-containing protein [Nocardiopsis sp. EMB25]
MTARERHAALIEAMIADGTLTDPALIDTFRAVPRHRYIPESGALTHHGTPLNAVNNPELWLAAVYTDDAIGTRVEGVGLPRQRGETASEPRSTPPRVATSSSSAPTVLARMLELAELANGQHVLEIGTGTGWNTALLAHRLGDSAVTSVEIDARVAATARGTLHAEGYSPSVEHADGYGGWPSGAPYDRITSTCGVRRVPPAWTRQTRAGGLIVCPWGLLEGAGVIVRLERAEDGSVTGTFHGGVGFVSLRTPGPSAPPVRDSGQQPDEYRLTQTDPLAPLTAFTSAFALSVLVPDWRVRRRWIGTGSGVWVCDHSGESWVRVYPYGTSWMIEQGGPRSIWDEFEDALAQWERLDRPEPERFGLSVDAEDGHRVWLDSPDGPGWTV